MAQSEPTQADDETWRGLLTGELEGLRRMRRMMGWIPSDPRCKLCAAPFGNPGSALLRLIGFGPSPLNRRICRVCVRSVDKKPGGAELEISLLFADVRGSTALAEKLSPQDFSRLMSRFYVTAAKAVDHWDGIVDKFVGDEVVALFIPGFAGEDHAARALEAARELMRETENDGNDPWITIGAGVHTGVAYVGTVGDGDARDFTALGDPVNTAARLASSAGPGEVLVSSDAAEAAGLELSELETRTLTLRGRGECVVAAVATTAAEAPATT